MREIKFRAWDKVVHEMKEVMGLNLWYEEFSEMKFNSVQVYQPVGAWIDSDEVVLMQFTGLKDKNKVEIYEGDIVSHYATVGTVLFEDGMFTLSSSANIQFGKYKQPLCYIDVLECEVIGNKFENPELLKEVKECYVQ